MGLVDLFKYHPFPWLDHIGSLVALDVAILA
jgi:hypothetical protein